MEDMREILRLVKDDVFERVEMWDLYDGDYFKMYEPTGEPVKNERGETLFKVLGNPKKSEIGTWFVHIEQ